MSVVYVKSDAIGRKIVPAPIITINKEYSKNADGTNVGTLYNLTLRGTLLPFRGSPSGSYSSLDTAFWTGPAYPPDEIYSGGNEEFNHLLLKQSALRWLFNEDGGSLEWQPSGGQPVVKCNPRVLSIDFEEGPWVNRCDYTIQLETNWIFINGTEDVEDSISQDLISSSSESWDFEEIEGRDGQQFNVIHRINAQGVLGYDTTSTKFENKEAWEHAKDYVVARVSGAIDSNIITSVLGSSKVYSNYVKVTNVDKNQGTYEITESWLASDASSYTEQQFNVDFDNNTGEFNVTYQGNIIGLSQGQNAGDILNLEVARSAIPTNDQARTITNAVVGVLLGGKVLPNAPQTKTFALDKQNGTVNFTFRWTTSEDEDVVITEEAQYNFSIDNMLHTITFNLSIEGVGDTSDEKTDNAMDAIYTDTQAYNRAIDLLEDQIPNGVDIEITKISKTVAVNHKTGSVRVSWSWNNRDINNTEVTIQEQLPNEVIASITVPGRAAGPIIQDMGTETSLITTVTIRSRNHTTKPTLTTEDFATGFIVSDNFTWNPQLGTAERTTRFLEDS